MDDSRKFVEPIHDYWCQKSVRSFSGRPESYLDFCDCGSESEQTENFKRRKALGYQGKYLTSERDRYETLRKSMELNEAVKNSALRGPGSVGISWSGHSPSDIRLVLHYYAIPTESNDAFTDTGQESIKRLVADGIFRTISKNPFIEVTEKGRMWVEMICSTPYPETRLVDPDGRVVPREVKNG